MKNRTKFTLLYHGLILFPIGIAMFVYLNELSFFSLVVHNDGTSIFHLILTIPWFLIGAFLVRLFLIQHKGGSFKSIFMYFPIACLILISGYFFAISLYYSESVLLIGFFITLALLVIEFCLLELDLKQQPSQIKQIF